MVGHDVRGCALAAFFALVSSAAGPKRSAFRWLAIGYGLRTFFWMGCAGATHLRDVGYGGVATPDGGALALDECLDAGLCAGGCAGSMGFIAGGVLVEFCRGGRAFCQ